MTSDVIIIAGGSTVADYIEPPDQTIDLRSRGMVIAVNDAFMRAHAHTVITMDRKWLEYRYDQVRIALMTGQLQAAFGRKGTTQNVHSWASSAFTWFDAKNTSEALDTSPDYTKLNGSNSGIVAINLAMKMKPKRIFLLGFDMKQRDGKAYWYPPYPWAKDAGTAKPGKYKGWAKEFSMLREQVRAVGSELINVTHDSAIPERIVPRMTFEQFLEATK